jgi:hypothetical protein
VKSHNEPETRVRRAAEDRGRMGVGGVGSSHTKTTSEREAQGVCPAFGKKNMVWSIRADGERQLAVCLEVKFLP